MQPTVISTTNSKPTSPTITSTIANQTLVSTKHGNNSRETIHTQRVQEKQHTLNCSEDQTCANNYPTTTTTTTTLETEEKEVGECPEYFRWIHEDLKAWKGKGISREMVETGKKTAHFRLVVKNGKAYVEKYKKSIQTRDVFTMWGILQLLRRYPGKVPDLELMFDCDDKPVIQTRHYGGSKFNSTGPPPLFRYCGDRWTEDIVFPDWSFWGWYVP